MLTGVSSVYSGMVIQSSSRGASFYTGPAAAVATLLLLRCWFVQYCDVMDYDKAWTARAGTSLCHAC